MLTTTLRVAILKLPHSGIARIDRQVQDGVLQHGAASAIVLSLSAAPDLMDATLLPPP